MTAIEVAAIRRLDGKTAVKAFVDIRLGGVTIKGAKVVQQEGQAAWVAMPSVKTERAWQTVIELSKELRAAVTDVVLAEWERMAIPLPIRGGQQSHASLEERANTWSRAQRGDRS